MAVRSAAKEKIGIIQTRGIGDLIIALPIARYYIDRGAEVHWPIDEQFVGFMSAAEPQINFLPVKATEDPAEVHEYFYHAPHRMLSALGCDRIFCLYNYLNGLKIENERYAGFLKFDEYKYAVAGVPFAEKWNLKIKRDRTREKNLFKKLDVTKEYICVHAEGSLGHLQIDMPEEWKSRYQLVQISPLTENPFDWIYTLEKSSIIVTMGSSFSNLVEQLALPQEKYLVLTSKVAFTPVYKNGWRFF